MLAFQNWNQVILNLSQVTSVIQPIQNVRTSCRKAHDNLKQHNVMCSASFIETLKNLYQSDNRHYFTDLPKNFFSTSLLNIFFNKIGTPLSDDSDHNLLLGSHKNLFDLQSWNHIKVPAGSNCDSRQKLYLNLNLNNNKFVTVSTAKHDDKYNVLQEKYLLHLERFQTNRIFSLKTNSMFSLSTIGLESVTTGIQKRGFKTERNVKAEMERNPGILPRVKKIFSFQENDLQQVENAIETASLKDPVLKNFFSDKSTTPEEKYKVKLAFAEGYMTGCKKPKRMLKATKLLVTLGVGLILGFLWILFTALLVGKKYIFQMRLLDKSQVNPEEIDVTFDDVRGAEEAKQELQEVVEFLKNPEKFSTLGGKLPKGILLVGPPGTGKTLLARAVAGEAGVPFFHMAGPEFDEFLVGQGAKRVRQLFRSAKEKAPCVVFIDEIDSVGSKRSDSVFHPYANQTINQLLTEMDGFNKNEGVIVLGATNRKQVLDKALLRPGRFDVEVKVSAPDFNGRKEILDLYLGKILCKDIDVDLLARGTIGFTGADIENMVNQAALRAAIEGADWVTMDYLDYARDKLIMGPERKSKIPDEETNLITAYHEGGHAIVAYYTEDSQPLHKITIMPRNETLGHTAFVPDKENYFQTKAQLLARLDTLLGGRAAEELVFGPNKITSGASNDLTIATKIATLMVKNYGMSEKVGLRKHQSTYSNYVVVNEWGQTASDQIDFEIKRIIQESYERAKNILKKHAKEHKILAEALLKHETLNSDDVKAILNEKSGKEKNSASTSPS